jgi:hypothetical protein
MADLYANWKSTTGTKTRVKDISPTSGMCPICVSSCQVLCEIGKSAFRGREVLYPEPEEFGASTAASNKDYFLDWSAFQILTTVTGIKGMKADSDLAIFPNVDVSTSIAGIPLKIPVFIAGLGSTPVAKKNWAGLSGGAAISGTIQVIGENVCGMDENAIISAQTGKIVKSPDLEERVKKYREFWDGKHGDIAVQTNVEDTRLGVDEYASSKLEVNIIERKWGQGAKAIGGEVRISNLKKAQLLKSRGYIVLPDPEDERIIEAFKNGVFKSFERHSRVGFPKYMDFLEDIDTLRESGVKKVFLKTGAYRFSDVAFTLRVASDAKIDLVTFDGAGGGTGMSPVPMMNECSTPTVFLQAQVLTCLKILKEHNKWIPDIAMAGGFTNETQIFKSIAMSNFGDGPFIKAIAMARAPLTAVMKGATFSKLAKKGKLPKVFANKYGTSPENFFVTSPELKAIFGKDFEKIDHGAIGLYSYFYDRLKIGLQQLMAGSRRFSLKYLHRDDIASLSELATKVTGIPMIHEIDKDKIEGVLLSQEIETILV